MASNALKKITTAAKKIRRARPGVSWKSAIKQAGVAYRGGKLKGRKKSVTKRKAAPRKRAVAKRSAAPKKRTVAGSLAKHISAAKDLVKEKLSAQLLRKDLATKKRDKNKYQKLITATRAQLRKLSK